jgi:hypothetical protein
MSPSATYTVDDAVLTESDLTDDELAALALAEPLDGTPWEGAVPDPLSIRAGQLPTSYMPPSMAGTHSRAMRLVAVLIVAGLLFVTAAGFCVTYGQLSFA